MNEIFLLKLGEIILKGSNKRQFENKLRHNIRRRMKPYGNFDVYILQSTVYVEPQDEEADLEGAWEACKSVFGVNSICRCRPCEKTMDAIFDAVEAYLGNLSGTVAAKTAAVPGLACKYEKDLISKLSKLADEISDAASSLDTTLIRLKAIPDVTDAAYVIRDVVLQKMAELRVVCDEAESITADKYWPFPTYGDLLFGVR